MGDEADNNRKDRGAKRDLILRSLALVGVVVIFAIMVGAVIQLTTALRGTPDILLVMMILFAAFGAGALILLGIATSISFKDKSDPQNGDD